MTSTSGNLEYTTPAIEAFYREHRIRWNEFYESERVVLAELGMTSASAVLDIGCGCGGLGLALRERFGVTDYTGIEINRQAAETARRMNPTARVVCGDFLDVPTSVLPKAGFDLVISLSCIDWNLQFADMLARAWHYVRPGGCLVASFRLTAGESQLDIGRSYQYINFEARKEGEVAPYVVLNAGELMRDLRALLPAQIRAFGYWGAPSPTAVTTLGRIGFAVVAVHKGTRPVSNPTVNLDLPPELVEAALRG